MFILLETCISSWLALVWLDLSPGRSWTSRGRKSIADLCKSIGKMRGPKREQSQLFPIALPPSCTALHLLLGSLVCLRARAWCAKIHQDKSTSRSSTIDTCSQVGERIIRLMLQHMLLVPLAGSAARGESGDKEWAPSDKSSCCCVRCRR